MQKKKKNNKTIILATALLIVLVGIGVVYIILNQNNIKSKLVSNNQNKCENSTESFNGLTVKLNQSKDNDWCTLDSLMVNNNNVNLSSYGDSIDSYEFFDNNLIISISTRSSVNMIIYSASENKVVFNAHNDLPEVFLSSYSIDKNKIIISTNPCSVSQCGVALYDSNGNIVNDLDENEKFPTLKYEMEYSNGIFSKPKLASNLYHWK